MVAAPSVDWTAPSDCPDRDAATQAITAGLDARADLRVEVAVTTSDAGFTADVTIATPEGETTRRLASPQCASLVDAVALIAAAAESERVSIAAPEPEPEAEPDVDAVAPDPAQVAPAETEPDVTASSDVVVARPPPAEPPQRRPPAPRRVALHARAFGLLGWGVTPVVDGGGGVAGGISVARFRGEAFARAMAPTRETIDVLPTASARVWAWSAGLRGCGIVWATAEERLAIAGCGGLGAGQITGSAVGTGLTDPGTIRSLWVVALLGPSAVARLTPWLSIVADVELRVPLVRPGFGVRDGQTVHRPAPAGVSGTVGLELHFPRRIRWRPGME